MDLQEIRKKYQDMLDDIQEKYNKMLGSIRDLDEQIQKIKLNPQKLSKIKVDDEVKKLEKKLTTKQTTVENWLRDRENDIKEWLNNQITKINKIENEKKLDEQKSISNFAK